MSIGDGWEYYGPSAKRDSSIVETMKSKGFSLDEIFLSQTDQFFYNGRAEHLVDLALCQHAESKWVIGILGKRPHLQWVDRFELEPESERRNYYLKRLLKQPTDDDPRVQFERALDSAVDKIAVAEHAAATGLVPAMIACTQICPINKAIYWCGRLGIATDSIPAKLWDLARTDDEEVLYNVGRVLVYDFDVHYMQSSTPLGIALYTFKRLEPSGNDPIPLPWLKAGYVRYKL